MEMLTLSPKNCVAETLNRWPEVVPVLMRHHMSCVGCGMSSFETLEDAARIYGVDLQVLMGELNQAIIKPEAASAENHSTDNQPKERLMTTPYTFFPEIANSIDTIPEESIVSRTVYRDDGLKAIVFAFAPGQELSEHTASVPAIIQILEGDCELTLGEDRYEVKAGAWARMPANLPHSILARTPVKMLLLML